MRRNLVLGVDFGTASVRAIVVDALDGSEIGHGLYAYQGGEDGCIPTPGEISAVRHDPREYVAGLEKSILAALCDAETHAGISRSSVVGIGVDSTGSTIFPVLKDGTPLACQTAFKNDVNAKIWLWKDHSAIEEAEEITHLAKERYPGILEPIGGRSSAEMFWPKVLHCLRIDRPVYDAAWSWVEMLDWIPFLLTGGSDVSAMQRSACGAGAKAFFNMEWGGYPPASFFMELDPALPRLLATMPVENVRNVSKPSGTICKEWATKLGLSPDVVVSMGSFDAHFGGIGAGIKEGILVETIGTSACDLCLVPKKMGNVKIDGMFDIVKDSILPGWYGIEAGQSSVGDIFGWFVNDISPQKMSFGELGAKAALLEPGESGLLALDWLNGNRSLFLDQRLTGLVLGLTLHTKPEEIYRALVEATGFGGKMIIEQIMGHGVPVNSIVVCGGIPHKDPVLMQIYADIFDMTISVASSKETCALGGAVVAAVNAGVWENFDDAIEHMTHVNACRYVPEKDKVAVYDRLFALYKGLSFSFGKKNYQSSLFSVMKDLIAIREGVLKMKQR